MRRLLCLLVLAGLCCCGAMAADPIIKINGTTPITNLLAAKSTFAEKSAVVIAATDTAMKERKYPFDLVKSTTEVKIQKFRCDEKMGACAYWIEAYRDGREVAVNNPIWLVNPTIYTIVSTTVDTKTGI